VHLFIYKQEHIILISTVDNAHLQAILQFQQVISTGGYDSVPGRCMEILTAVIVFARIIE